MTHILIFAAGMAASGALAAPLTLSSTVHQTTLIELYTSEGCSSCPPADRWLSVYKDDERLWRAVVPVAFHVDYWDSLGWRDRFSDSRYSRRQQRYKDYGHLAVVYTPGVLRNGREWRGWRHGGNISRTGRVGVLRAVIDHAEAWVVFKPVSRYRHPPILNVALLGFDLSSRVAAGENKGRLLRHDFVVLDFSQYRQAIGGDEIRWEIDGLPTGKAQGIALWVSEADDPTPLQATGGWLQ